VQLAVEPVNPGVIRALEARDLAATLLHEGRGYFGGPLGPISEPCKNTASTGGSET
jgi:hypothetical protein